MERKVKKLIIYPMGTWAEKLLSIADLKRVDYVICDETSQKGQELWHGKPIYTASKLLDENPNDIIIIIADSKCYKRISRQLEQMGFIENKHYFNGWNLPEEYFLEIKASNWQNCEETDTFARQSWDERASIMAAMIPQEVHSIIDLGCGNQRLKNFLRQDIQYTGLDYRDRGENTVVCDVNKEKLPQIDADCTYMAGFLMYVENLKDFIGQLNTKYILFSYEGRESHNSFGLFQNRGMMPCMENHKNLWEVIQWMLDNQYRLIKISGRYCETFCLFEKYNWKA